MLTDLIYIFYLIVLVGVFSASQYSSDYFKRSIGLIVLSYQLPCVVRKYQIDYFGKDLFVDFGFYHYAVAIIFDLILWLVLSVKIKPLENKNRVWLGGYFYFTLILAIAAFIVDAAFNAEYFFLSKALRFSREVSKVQNLAFIDIDWLVIFLAGGVTLFARNRRAIGLLVISSCALVGLLLGMRYYIAIPAIFFFIETSNKWSGKAKIIAGLLFVLVVPISGSFLNALKSYVAFYEWVGNQPFLDYWLQGENSLLVSGEIGAIGANFYLGIKEGMPAVDFFSYFFSIVPFANRFYDFAQQNTYYSIIASYLPDIDVTSGQGTAFNVILEFWSSAGMPLFLLFVLRTVYVKYVSGLNQNNTFCIASKVILTLVFFNFVRNGLVVTISLLRVYFVLFCAFFSLFFFYRLACFVDSRK